ncbi:MAG: tRNA (N6-threonylcarbamoyladenosine(37)-N6)-methyltransferase TrmO [Clostridia bacterium]|nr:tRNA (N6-threonylcarbamoyladenosine(37)-N6)-methyltransferase TrmO [Clostridia bacterium]
MDSGFTFRPIARAHNAYTDKFAVPRQSGLVPEVLTRLVFEPEYDRAEALRGLEGFSHLWLIWVFDRAMRDDWSPTVRPPRLGGNRRMGVFATRSPFRPNPIGLSCVRLVSTEPGCVTVAGADLADGTPIFDIKPYLPYADAFPDARSGYVAPLAERPLDVDCPPGLLARLPEADRAPLLAVLSRDPRPAYQQDTDRVYGFVFAGRNVRFTVRDGLLTVVDIGEVTPP